MKLFFNLVQPEPKHKVLDIGFNEIEYSYVDNMIEKAYPYPEQLTALGITGKEQFEARYPKVRAVLYDGKVFPFEDKEFDICWSNAVIEHVGTREEQIFFVKEMARTCKFGFFTTPNKHFPFEVHTRTPLLHWLPKSWFDAYLRLIKKKWATGKYMNLLSIGDMKKVLKAAGINNYNIRCNRFFGFVMDFVVIFGSLDDAS